MAGNAGFAVPPPDGMQSPSAILFDMDGVMAEVSESFRASIIKTAATFGVEVTKADIDAVKLRGGANNDWVVTFDLVTAGGVSTDLAEVTKRFEEFYQGTADEPGLYLKESLLTVRGLLEELNLRCPSGMAVVTGRPRADALKFLEMHKLDHLFRAVVCMEDGPPKPDPFPVQQALKELDVAATSSIMIGDTVDDVRSAVASGVPALGVLTPPGIVDFVSSGGDDLSAHPVSRALMEAGASAVLLPGLVALLDLVPRMPADRGVTKAEGKALAIN